MAAFVKVFGRVFGDRGVAAPDMAAAQTQPQVHPLVIILPAFLTADRRFDTWLEDGHLTGVLARELGPRGIRVNAVSPGLIETEGTHTAGAMGPDFQTWNESQTPLGRVGQVEDIASIVAFLASDEAGWVTGELILGSGGMR